MDPGYIGFDDVQRDLTMGKDRILARLAENPHRRLVEDTIREMGWWACFRDERPSRVKGAAQASRNSKSKAVTTRALARIKKTKPKIVRNEPCTCGSGKKYKKCCGA